MNEMVLEIQESITNYAKSTTGTNLNETNYLIILFNYH